MIYTTIFCKSFYRNGDQTRIELVPYVYLYVCMYVYIYIYNTIYIYTSIFHEKTLCLSVLKFWDGYQFFNSQDPAVPQSNSSCLGIDHFREIGTGSIKLGHTFTKFIEKKNIIPRNPVVPSELKRLK